MKAISSSLTKLNLFLCLSLLTIFLVQGLSGRWYEPYWSSELVYRPYLKYYDGRIALERKEKPLRVYGPGFYSDFMEENIENVYICMNGMWVTIEIFPLIILYSHGTNN